MTSQSVNANLQIRPDGARSLWPVIVLAGCCILGAIIFSYYRLQTAEGIFFATRSPNGTYSVSLKGDKSRTLLLRHEVRADVVKFGKPFVDDIFIHSSHNAFDLSFEAGFPDFRWLSDNTLEFYRREYFEKGYDSLTIENSSKTAVKYLRVQALSKFLIFDVEPASSISLQIPAPRGDSQWIAIEGDFNDGQGIGFYHRSFDRSSTQRDRSSYKILITTSGPQIL